MVTANDDAALVGAARGGNRDAFAALLGRHWPLIVGLCRRMVGDSDLAMDAAQEAAVQALLSLDRLRQPERFGPWLGGIGLNVCRMWLRERPRESWSWEALQGGRRVAEPVDWHSGPAERAEAADLAASVQQAVAELPRGQRAAVLLFYLADLSYVETAAHLGIAIGAVKARLHKARAALRRRLWEVWMDEQMGAEAAGSRWVEMRVGDVRRTTADAERPNRHVVVLEHARTGDSLLIWIGPFEGTALATQLERVGTTRPLTFAFAASTLQAAGGRLREVRITRLVEETYYAVAVIEGPTGLAEVDARPSDALTLAILLGAPILVEAAVLATAEGCLPPDHRQAADLAEFRERSVGAKEIVAEWREQWYPKPAADPAVSPASGG